MDNQTLTHMTIADTGLQNFKLGVDNLLEKRKYFISQVLPLLKLNEDYYEIRGRRCLSKGGAEKLAGMLNLVATFKKDVDSMECFRNLRGIVCFTCELKRNGELHGEGRGADSLQRNQEDPNKTVKMAQKRSFVDAVIRTACLSDLFTQDLDDELKTDEETTPKPTIEQKGNNFILPGAEMPKPITTPRHSYVRDYEENKISGRQIDLLKRLILQKVSDREDRDRRLSEIFGLSKQEAFRMINDFIADRI